MSALYTILGISFCAGFLMFMSSCGTPGPDQPDAVSMVGACIMLFCMAVGILADI
jgi:hypothetical protein